MKNRAIQIFNLTPQMSNVGLLLTYVVYPLVLLLEFSKYCAASPGNSLTFNLMTVVFFVSTFAVGGFLSLKDEKSVSQPTKTLIFFMVTLIPTLAFHSAKFVFWLFQISLN